MNRDYKDYRLGFTNIKEELNENVSLEVRGSLPSWLSGSLYRNGPGIFEVPKKDGNGTFSIPHWFDGLTVLHKFTIESNGDVKYMNRHVTKEAEEELSKLGRHFGVSFGKDPCKTIFNKFFTLFEMGKTDANGRPIRNIGVTLGQFNGEFWSKTDSASIMKFDPDTLESQGIYSYEEIFPQLKGQLSAAHSQFDNDRKEFLNFVTEVGRNATYRVFALQETSNEKVEERVLATIQAPAVYIHSFAVTKNYMILILWPLMINTLGMLWEKSIEGSLSWQPEGGTTFYVIDRIEGGHVATYKSEAFFSFHNINAFEQEGDIIIDLTAYNDASVVHSFNRDNIMRGGKEDKGSVRRFTLENVKNATTSNPSTANERIIFDGTLELPRFNQKFHMKSHQFVYGIGHTAGHIVWDCLVKLDNHSGQVIRWEEEGCHPGEPIFVPTPNDSEEDAGVLLSVVLSGPEQRSFLLVLDAKTMTEVARSYAPQVVPFGFHGNFFPTSQERTDQ